MILTEAAFGAEAEVTLSVRLEAQAVRVPIVNTPGDADAVVSPVGSLPEDDARAVSATDRAVRFAVL